MSVFSIIGIIILVIIGLCIAPLMTISYVFFHAGWGTTGDILGVIFLILGIINMFSKLNK